MRHLDRWYNLELSKRYCKRFVQEERRMKREAGTGGEGGRNGSHQGVNEVLCHQNLGSIKVSIKQHLLV